jgi:hypothetical protein
LATPDMKGKLVSLAGIGRVGVFIAGMWRWHPALVKNARYPPDVLQHGIDWINDECLVVTSLLAVSINAGGKLNSQHGKAALAQTLKNIAPSWGG